MEHELQPGRRGGASPWTTVAVVFSALAAVLVAAAFIVAFANDPPPLVWVRFAIVATVVLALTALTLFVFERPEAGAQRQHVDRGRNRR